MSTLSKNDDRFTRIRNITGITIGNAIEFYDFAIYGTFAVLIGRLYFPGESDFAKQMLTFATLGVGFLMRPLGAVLIGLYSDRYGRKPALIFTMWLMALGTFIFVVTPTYQQIGMIAPILIVLARLIQGFAIGGELGSSTTMLMEYADDHSRGFYGSWQVFGQGLNTLLASGVGVAIGHYLPEAEVGRWGWRLGFAGGLIIIPIALYIRRFLPETAKLGSKKESSGLGLLFTEYPRELLGGILIIMGSTVSIYIVLFYMSNYAITQLNFPFAISMRASCVAALIQVCLVPFVGKLSDKVGRKKIIFWSRLPIVLLIYPMFVWLNSEPTLSVLLIVVFILSIFLVFNATPSLIICAENFPSHVRTTGLSMVYSIAVMIFGGFAQFIATWMIQITGNPNAPAFYVIGTGLVSLLGLCLLKEMTGKPLE